MPQSQPDRVRVAAEVTHRSASYAVVDTVEDGERENRSSVPSHRCNITNSTKIGDADPARSFGQTVETRSTTLRVVVLMLLTLSLLHNGMDMAGTAPHWTVGANKACLDAPLFLLQDFWRLSAEC